MEQPKRFLLVNIDKRQQDVTATDELRENEQQDCIAFLTLIIDLKEGRASLGGVSYPISAR